MGILGGIIGGIAGFGQGLIQRQTDKLNAQRNYEMNLKLQNYQYSKDVEMWNRANEYNSPSAQMARYQSAGLNPNLIYGTGSASAGNTATALPKYQAPTYRQDYSPSVNLPMVLSMFQDFRIKQAQVDNLREQNRILVSTADMKFLESLAYGQQEEEHDRTVGLSTLPLIKREIVKSQMLRSQADAERVVIDKALKELQLRWFKKIGVSGLGGIINAGVNVARMFR